MVYSVQKKEFGEHLAKVDWLPSSASDISFTRSYGFTAYEFTMDFDEFIAYAGSKNWHMTKFDTRKGIYCYLHALKQSGRKVEPSDAFVFISAGHSYDVRQSNGGGVSVIYDSNNKRAYVTTSPR